MATSIHFKQYDSRWGKKKYPSWGTGTYRYCGCGPTTVATVVSSVIKSITPKQVGDWISKQKQGATKGGATYWATGIIPALKHFGFTVKTHGAMKDFFKTMYEGQAKDVYGILDVYGSKGDVTWTAGGGHYIPVTAIKKSGKDDWLIYVKDPSLRNNTGWYSYKKHLMGHCKLALTCYYPSKAVTVSKSEQIVAKAKELAYAKGTSSASYSKGQPKAAYKTALNTAYPDRSNWSKPYRVGASCDIFVGTVMRSLGVKDYPRGRGTSWSNGQMDYLAKSKSFKEVKVSEAKAGDIIIYSKDAKGKTGHTCIILNSTDVAEASYGDFYPKVTGSLKTRLSGSGKSKIKIYRWI